MSNSTSNKSTCTSARCALQPLPFSAPASTSISASIRLSISTRHTHTPSDSTERSPVPPFICLGLVLVRSLPVDGRSLVHPPNSTRFIHLDSLLTPNPFPHPHALSSILTSLTFSYLVQQQCVTVYLTIPYPTLRQGQPTATTTTTTTAKTSNAALNLHSYQFFLRLLVGSNTHLRLPAHPTHTRPDAYLLLQYTSTAFLHTYMHPHTPTYLACLCAHK
ncbi:hypothetical protein EDB81DRAFT_440874 [Dactylonectria macrodidyma]|uniref:Uncharacterized protein n=1 Tax=Dactylonectria macrodidyma TaxID=307937 RepID=A0A9P9F206_9HYPO|nr:hypothetical protein EDB81DRAFT_440874 [Dactylonectria macrodidyma]